MPAQIRPAKSPLRTSIPRYSSSTSTPRTYRTQMIPTAGRTGVPTLGGESSCQQCRHPCEDPEPDPDVLAALLRPVDVEVWHGELHPSDTPLITGSVPVGEERQQDQRMAQEPDPCNTEKGVTACVALEVGEPARACRGWRNRPPSTATPSPSRRCIKPTLNPTSNAAASNSLPRKSPISTLL